MDIILIICGAFNIVFSLIVNTKNIQSAIVYKVLPFIAGVFTILCGMNIIGYVNIW